MDCFDVTRLVCVEFGVPSLRWIGLGMAFAQIVIITFE